MKPRTTFDLVLGVCSPERRRIASALSETAAHLDDDLTPGETRQAIDGFAAIAPSGTAVIDCPSSASAADLIDQFDGTDGLASGPLPVALRSVITVVDAAHLMTDLHRDDYFEVVLDGHGDERQLVPWALIAVTQIEYASLIAVVGWRDMERTRLDEVVALLCHLNPRARIRLERKDWTRHIATPPSIRTRGHRPGWVQILDGRLDAGTGVRNVDTIRYDRLRPFHPERLLAAFETALPEAAGGKIIRSAGVCRFATRLGFPARWDQVGDIVSFDPFEDPESESPQGQEIAMIGFDLDERAVVEVLDACLLTDDEFLTGPAAWSALPDPLPRWLPGLR